MLITPPPLLIPQSQHQITHFLSSLSLISSLMGMGPTHKIITSHKTHLSMSPSTHGTHLSKTLLLTLPTRTSRLKKPISTTIMIFKCLLLHHCCSTMILASWRHLSDSRHPPGTSRLLHCCRRRLRLGHIPRDRFPPPWAPWTLVPWEVLLVLVGSTWVPAWHQITLGTTLPCSRRVRVWLEIFLGWLEEREVIREEMLTWMLMLTLTWGVCYLTPGVLSSLGIMTVTIHSSGLGSGLDLTHMDLILGAIVESSWEAGKSEIIKKLRECYEIFFDAFDSQTFCDMLLFELALHDVSINYMSI